MRVAAEVHNASSTQEQINLQKEIQIGAFRLVMVTGKSGGHTVDYFEGGNQGSGQDPARLRRAVLDGQCSLFSRCQR